MLKFILSISVIMIIISYQSCSQQDEYYKLISEAISHYRDGDHQKAGETFDKAFKIGDPAKEDFYNACCSWALAGNKDKAFDLMNKAIDAGWLDASHFQDDPDLKILRDDPRWESMIEKINRNISDIENGFPDKHLFLATVELPEPSLTSDYSVEEAFQNRRSVRSYAEEPLSLKELSQILWAAYGITKKLPGAPAFLRGGFRAAPSAGALYPLDIYVVAGDVDGLEDGIYLYDSENHLLKMTKKGDFREKLAAAALSQTMLAKAPFSLVYSAIFERTTKKYGKRGRERYVMMDLGHSAQNVYLQAGSLGLGTCAIGAFTDIGVKQLINMTKEEEPLYLMPVGKLK
jgi:SagB-type dehydrogenase family enzyme